MLINTNDILDIFNKYQIKITGVLHIGAHNCEELPFYRSLSLNDDDIIWIDGIESKVIDAKNRNIPNVYHAVITDKDFDIVKFNITNNVASSSIFELGTHIQEHPWIKHVDEIYQKSITVDTFFKVNNIDGKKYNLWNFDIQGAELLALKGAINNIQYADVLYLEVNTEELYKNIPLITEIDNFLHNYSFKRVSTYLTPHGWGDAIYVRVK